MEKEVIYIYFHTLCRIYFSDAKMGLTGITGELGLTIRTFFVSLFVLGIAAIAIPTNDYALLNRSNVIWLGLSGVTTTFAKNHRSASKIFSGCMRPSP